jgi:hypothetical protein
MTRNRLSLVISPPAKPDTPPDFPGPDIVYQDVDPISTGWVRTEDIGIRWTFWGNSFKGQPWFWWNLPRSEYTSYLLLASTGGEGQLCTLADNNCFPPF